MIDESWHPLACHLTHGPLNLHTSIQMHTSHDRFQTLSTLQPGIMSVYEDLLTPGGAMLRSHPLPESLIGKTYQEARRSFDTILVCGYIRDGQVQFLAKDTKKEVLKAGDKLVTLSSTVKQALPSSESKAVFENASAKMMARGMIKKAQESSKQKIIVVAMGPQVGTGSCEPHAAHRDHFSYTLAIATQRATSSLE